jgi:integrase
MELIIGTGLRKGEALALHWDDVDLDHGVLYVRWTLSAIDNNKLVMTTPKTKQSRDWVAMSPRLARILIRRRAEQAADAGVDGAGGGFAFRRGDRRPLHPQYVLNHFHYLTREAGVPRCTVHDLRHLALTIALTEGIDMAIVSKTARHNTISTTANIYTHLTKRAARQAVDAIAKSLDRAERRYDHPTTTRAPTRIQPTRSSQYGKAA